MSDKQSSKSVCYNKLVDAFKYSNPESSHSLAQQKAKAYYDTIKDKADFQQLVDTKISEWKRVGLKRRVNNNSFFSSWSKSKKTVSTESDVETLSPQPNEANVPNVELSPSAPEASTSGATPEPPPSKICHAEISLDKTIVDLSREIQKLKHVMSMNVISNPKETRKSIKEKETELQAAVKIKNTLIRSRINQKASRKKKKNN